MEKLWPAGMAGALLPSSTSTTNSVVVALASGDVSVATTVTDSTVFSLNVSKCVASATVIWPVGPSMLNRVLMLPLFTASPGPAVTEPSVSVCTTAKPSGSTARRAGPTSSPADDAFFTFSVALGSMGGSLTFATVTRNMLDDMAAGDPLSVAVTVSRYSLVVS